MEFDKMNLQSSEPMMAKGGGLTEFNKMTQEDELADRLRYRVDVTKLGSIFYYNHRGELHREGGPAIESHNGGNAWYRNGQLHREDGPAVKYANGDLEWWIDGKLHREGGPAVERAVGDREWYQNGILQHDPRR